MDTAMAITVTIHTTKATRNRDMAMDLLPLAAEARSLSNAAAVSRPRVSSAPLELLERSCKDLRHKSDGKA